MKESPRAGRLLGAAAVAAGSAVPRVHAAEDNTLQVALVGCGGRGTGAAANALSVQNGPIKLVALADVFEDRLKPSAASLKQGFPQTADVPEDRKFVGFDAYRHAMDCLKRGDIVILATPPAFRWVQFAYAIEKGLHVFMEKPVTVDGPTTVKMLELAEESEKKNLKVGVGLMWRHCEARKALNERIRDGAIGDVVVLRTYRMTPPIGSAFAGPKPEGENELLYQIRRFHAFLWASGGCYSDFLIHSIDECCWMKGEWPVEAQGSGGRHFRADYVDQNFDNYSVEYTFADGTKLYMNGRNIVGCYEQFAGFAHGSKGCAIIDETVYHARSRVFKGQRFAKEDLVWAAPQPEPNPYQLEWDHLVAAIRQDKPHNEARRGAEASLVTSMGRMAAHTGQVVTYDQILHCDHEFAPGVDQFTTDSAAPVQADASGKYPIPLPGITTRREYES